MQRLFNSQEENYPIIDNLSPESAGARYRMADRGVWGTAEDVARFIQFNLFETSLRQKIAALGEGEDPNGPPKWDVPAARQRGHKLFALALNPSDPFRATLMDEGNDASKAVREQLDRVAADPRLFPDDDVRLMCDQMAIQTNGKELCKTRELGALLQALLTSKRSVIGAHLKGRLGEVGLGKMRVFIYAHTHQLEEQWTVDATASRSVDVYNTGAFQRLVNEPGFLRRASAKKLTPAEALKSLDLKDLAPCYSAVVIAPGSALPKGKTVMWLMPEDGVGEFTVPGDMRCQ